MTDRVGIIGIGQSNFRSRRDDASYPDLVREAVVPAMLDAGLDFDAIDGQPVDIVLVLLLPAAAEHEALGALALVARTLRSPENLVRLRGAKNASELYSALLG